MAHEADETLLPLPGERTFFAGEVRLTRENTIFIGGKPEEENCFSRRVRIQPATRRKRAGEREREIEKEKVTKPGRASYGNEKNFKTRCVTPGDT
mgnify:CR=1 FL=1